MITNIHDNSFNITIMNKTIKYEISSKNTRKGEVMLKMKIKWLEMGFKVIFNLFQFL